MTLKFFFSFLQSMLGFKEFGKNSFIVPPLRVWNKDSVRIGSNVHIGPFSFLAVSKKFKKQRFTPSLKIGDNFEAGAYLFISCIDEIIIEKNVIVSQRVFIGDHEHEFQNIKVPILAQPLKKTGKVLIKEGSFIGVNTVVLPGVTIGRNSFIGASSVVTESIPDYSVAVGIPAKVIKKFNRKTNKWEKVKK